MFSYGVTLWELVALGEEPYACMQLRHDQLERLLSDGSELRPPMPPGVHPALADLITACWSERPAQRPDMSEVVVQLRQLQAQLFSKADAECPGWRDWLWNGEQWRK